MFKKITDTKYRLTSDADVVAVVTKTMDVLSPCGSEAPIDMDTELMASMASKYISGEFYRLHKDVLLEHTYVSIPVKLNGHIYDITVGIMVVEDNCKVIYGVRYP